jgi:hypothetical protein
MNVTAFAPQGGTYTFIGTHAGMEGKVVKGVPFSAEGVTETEKTLADGTKIKKKTTSKVYRDSEGRTRREMTLGAVGPWVAEGEATTTVTINDPVAGRMYVMRKGGKEVKTIDVVDPEVDVEIEELKQGKGKEAKREIKIIRKQMSKSTSSATWVHKEHAEPGHHTVHVHDFTAGGKNVMLYGDKEGIREDLGERNIEGVVAKGTRTTHTIPEGKIGNDRPITVTTEHWYSEELGMTVLKETADPLSGNVIYRLTNIIRAEPDASLFEMDEDVEMHEGHSIERRIRIERDEI